MPIVNSMGSGYYNYYNIASRYKCDTPYEAWYRKDLSKEEVSSNNSGVLNKDSDNADLYRKLEDSYAGIAESNRARYGTVEELRNALYQKYNSTGVFANYSQEQRNAMYINELSMTCFGTIGAHTGMGGGDMLADPHLKGNVTKNSGAESRTFNQTTLAAQFKNVFNRNGVNTLLFGNTKFNFTVNGMSKHLTVTILQEDENYPVEDSLIKQMEDALNTNKNASNLFYNMLYDSNKQGLIPNDVRIKYLLYSDFYQNTGFDIRDFTKTDGGYQNEKGEKASELYKKALATSNNVPTEFKGAAYDYFLQLEQESLKYNLSEVPDITLSLQYQSGTVMLATQNNHFDKQA